MSSLWRTVDLVAAIGGAAGVSLPEEITGISIDSRNVQSGEAFFAIVGDRLDGHAYVGKALAAGAGLAVVEKDFRPEPGAGGARLVRVADTLRALEDLGRAARARSSARIVAVTGSVGKTSTKEMLKVVFSGFGATHAPVGSFNNHWGVPLTLARMTQSAEFGIFEIGMNHAGEIRPLVKMVRPDVAIITNVEAAHLEFFDSEREIAQAKAEIFEGLEPGGTAIINRDNHWFDLLRQSAGESRAHILSFGAHEDADIRLVRAEHDEDGSRVEVAVQGETLHYALAVPGRHLVMNSLAVLAVVRALGLDLDHAGKAFAGVSALKGRGERIVLRLGEGEASLIDESYNANPASMRAALAVLAQARPQGSGRRIAVLGDMLELGADAARLHAELAEPLLGAGVDLVFLAGPVMKSLWQVLPEWCRGAYAEQANGLKSILPGVIGPGDVVMVKASAGTRLGPVADALVRQFQVTDPESGKGQDQSMQTAGKTQC
ncbi:MAG: UDP-N-acetylmuramoylalanyl-D-glutamyl-2,6-diaminopimelate--D-alanyl-D-alanine ligase [Hyphomicrobiales bacterium]|nr:UDP-N-acetylmuramoylalanyl-D-glutamyl-2,6-diaminopimelate--D-alanyl-D-alanine ligase [Hyphomicrobiales bacterium]